MREVNTRNHKRNVVITTTKITEFTHFRFVWQQQYSIQKNQYVGSSINTFIFPSEIL